MILYLRLWRRFALLELMRAAEYRANFALNVLVGALELGLAALTIDVLYRFTDAVAGWSRAELLVLLGVYQLVHGLIWLLYGSNLEAMPSAVRSGDLDIVLLRPVSSQFLLSARGLNLPSGVQALVGLLVVWYAGRQAGIAWGVGTAGAVGTAIFVGLCGLAIFYALWFMLATSTIWLVQLRGLNTLAYMALSLTRYPVSFYGRAVQLLLTVVLPVAFAVTLPAEALLGRADGRLVALGAALAAATLAASHALWLLALRHYSSASS